MGIRDKGKRSVKKGEIQTDIHRQGSKEKEKKTHLALRKAPKPYSDPVQL